MIPLPDADNTATTDNRVELMLVDETARQAFRLVVFSPAAVSEIKAAVLEQLVMVDCSAPATSREKIKWYGNETDQVVKITITKGTETETFYVSATIMAFDLASFCLLGLHEAAFDCTDPNWVNGGYEGYSLEGDELVPNPDLHCGLVRHSYEAAAYGEGHEG